MAVSRLSQTSLQNAFQKYNNVWDGKSAVGSMEAISAVTLTGTQSTIEFNNIPQTYSHLQLRILSRNATGAGTGGEILYARFNGDSGSTSYTYNLLYNTATASSSANSTGVSYAYLWNHPGQNVTANYYAYGVADILDYTNTVRYKTIHALGGWVDGSVGDFVLTSSSFKNSLSAITSISIASTTGNLAQYSSAVLYGVK